MRVEFLDDLVVLAKSKYEWQVERDFYFLVYRDGQGMLKTFVPRGFVTDFASVPRLPFMYALAGGKAPKSSTVHDYLYSTKAGRDFADAVFYAGMLAEGINKTLAWLMYRGVRLGGAARYGKS